MGKIAKRIICKDYNKLKNRVIEEGQKFRVQYVVFSPKENYLICDNEDVSLDDVMKDIKLFAMKYVPKFGKFEIEQFIGHVMVEALLITKDITKLFNMELLCDDLPYNITRVSSDIIKERILKCFEIVKKTNNITYLKFKWEEIK